MRRVLLLAFILATGCAGGGSREAGVSQGSSRSAKESDKYESAHPSATPSHGEHEDVGSTILGGVLQVIVDIIFGTSNGC